MSHYELYIEDEKERVDLTAAPFCIDDWYPRTARNEDTVVESFVVCIAGTAWRQRHDNTIGRLERIFNRATRRGNTRVGPRTFVYFRPEGSEELYRSEIVPDVREQSGEAGRVELQEQALRWKWDAGQIHAVVMFRRRFYWEGPEVELPLRNRHGQAVTGGLPVDNHTDADADNFVDILADDVQGHMPAPVRIEMENTTAGGSRLLEMCIAHNVQSDPFNFPHILEGEDAITGGATVANGAYSNGAYQQFTIGTTAETVMAQFTVSSALLDAARGNYFRIKAVFVGGTVTDDVRFQLRLGLFGLQTVWEGDFVFLNTTQVQDLGVIKLPPNLYQQSAGVPFPLVLTIMAQADNAPLNINIDHLQFLALDGWRFLRQIQFGAQFSDILVDDGIEGVTFLRDFAAGSGGQEQPNFIGEGEYISLWPCEDQRLYFLHESTSTEEPPRTINARVFYRPRRYTV